MDNTEIFTLEAPRIDYDRLASSGVKALDPRRIRIDREIIPEKKRDRRRRVDSMRDRVTLGGSPFE